MSDGCTSPPAGGPAVESLLAGLNPAQRSAVLSKAQPLCILAGAGSGKTRVLTRRIAYRVATGAAEPQHVLAVTFTRRAAGELRTRLGRLGLREPVAAGTFHGLALTMLRHWWAEREQQPLTVLDRKVRLMAPLLTHGEVNPGDVCAEIEWAKARLVSPETYPEAAREAGRRPPLLPAAMAAVFARYEQEKQRRRLIDFDDLLVLGAATLENDHAFAAAHRWRFRHLFVDEFQDVNPLQSRLLEAWRGDRLDLCVVGDPNQAIYGWNGADPGELTGFARRFPQAEVVHLDDNYRSSPQVLAVANAVLDSRPEGLARPLRPTRPDGPNPTILSYATDVEEAHGIAQALRRRGALGWSSLAVLTRTHAQLLLLERELRALAIPYRLRGAAPFMKRPEVVALVGELATSPAIPLRAAVADLRQRGDEVNANGGPDAERTHASMESLTRLAEEHLATDAVATAGGFVAWLATALGGDEAPGPSTGGAVELATFHAAKGLEWPVVFLAGLEHGLVPIGQVDTAPARAEERRLLYVAATRAHRELHCSWAQQRSFGSRVLARSPSPYLPALAAAVRDLDEGGSGADWRQFLDDSRGRVRRSDEWASRSNPRPARPDPAVLEALRSWRAAMARASAVPAFSVLHDTTLAAMAEAKPANRDGLLALPGLGPVKAERYGEALLAVVAGAVAS